MATRNLTDSFTQLRTEVHQSRDPSEPRIRTGSQHKSLLDDGGANPLSAARTAGPAVANMLPPAWVDAVEAVEREFATIDAQLTALKDKQRARLMVSFESDEAAQDADIERTGKAITSSFRKAESTLKKIQADTSGASGVSQSEAKLRGNVVRTLAGRLQDKSVAFRRTQKDFLARRSDQKSSTSGGALAGAEQGGGGGAFDFLGGGGSGEEKGSRGAALVDVGLDLGMEQGMTMEQLEAVDDMEVQVAKRDHEINSIVESIEELSQIFKELAVLVIDQGTVLDRIDYNMEQVVDKVEDGVVQLTKAEEYQKSARPRWCIAFLLFFISILMVLLVLKHRPKDNGDDQNDDAYDDTHSGSANSNNSLTGGVARMLRGHIASELEHHRQF